MGKEGKTLDEWIHGHGRTSGPSHEAIAREAAARAFEEVAEQFRDWRTRERFFDDVVFENLLRGRAAELRFDQVPTYNDD
jgi:hypothetical protein